MRWKPLETVDLQGLLVFLHGSKGHCLSMKTTVGQYGPRILPVDSFIPILLYNLYQLPPCYVTDVTARNEFIKEKQLTVPCCFPACGPDKGF